MKTIGVMNGRTDVSRFIRFEQCPRCALSGRDRSADNLGVYDDGGSFCFSCGFHKPARFSLAFERKDDHVYQAAKAVLPSDFTREIPAECWKWLLQYGLPMSYWKAYCGYSPKENRLIITFGEPIRFSIGRAFTVDHRKWRLYGNGHSYVETLGEQLPGPIVIVEDIISAHKVAHVAPSLCLFGTDVHDVAVKELKKQGRPVVLWLDRDQYTLLSKKIMRLQSLLEAPVTYISTRKDPKELTMNEIKEVIEQSQLK